VAVNQRGQIYMSQYHEKVPFIFTLEGKERWKKVLRFYFLQTFSVYTA
jgi:hypothetical protein